MEQEKIEQIIYETVDWDGFGMFGVDLAAAEIARLVEQEFEASAELGSKITDTDYQRLLEYRYQNEKSRVEALEAQLAEMGEALESLLDIVGSPDIHFTSDATLLAAINAENHAKQALSAAPEEVLWSGEGRVEHSFLVDWCYCHRGRDWRFSGRINQSCQAAS